VASTPDVGNGEIVRLISVPGVVVCMTAVFRHFDRVAVSIYLTNLFSTATRL
jgi:hypothetical protein